METYVLQQSENMQNLVRFAHQTDEPVVVFDGKDECLVAMRPSVFERILFDSNLLNCENRAMLHL